MSSGRGPGSESMGDPPGSCICPWIDHSHSRKVGTEGENRNKERKVLFNLLKKKHTLDWAEEFIHSPSWTFIWKYALQRQSDLDASNVLQSEVDQNWMKGFLCKQLRSISDIWPFTVTAWKDILTSLIANTTSKHFNTHTQWCYIFMHLDL